MYVNIRFIRHRVQSCPFPDPPADVVREVMDVCCEKPMELVAFYSSSTEPALVPYSSSTGPELVPCSSSTGPLKPSYSQR